MEKYISCKGPGYLKKSFRIPAPVLLAKMAGPAFSIMAMWCASANRDMEGQTVQQSPALRGEMNRFLKEVTY